MKRTGTYKSAALLLGALLLLGSCEFGLGSQVDTDTPTISISSPAISSVKGGSVTIAGSCNDDAGVSRVEVSLRGSQGETIPLGNATLGSGKTSWSIQADLSHYDDGSYSIVANAVDGADRHSTATREFTIDNTAPLVLLSKPNSFNSGDIGSGGYGKTVTIGGEILDDSDITQISVDVYRLGNDGSTSRVSLPHPTFTGFDVQGGLSLVIAQEGSDDRALSENYSAMYDTEGESTQLFTMVVTARDAAGNANTRAYIKSALNKAVSEATGTPVKDLISADYKKILNGTYEGLLDKAVVKAILQKSSGADVPYISDAARGVVFSICPDSSPKYEITGYDVTESFHDAERGAVLGMVLEKGLDAKLIDPATVDVSLYLCDEDGTYTAGASPVWTTKDAAEASGEYMAVYRKSKTGGQEYLKALTDEMDNIMFNLALPANVISGGEYYKIVVDGTDTDGNTLSPKMPAGYGFRVALHGGAPQVYCNDNEFYDGKFYQTDDFKQSGKAKLVLTVVDNSTDKEFGKEKSVQKVTTYVYTGHHASYDEAEKAVAGGTAKRGTVGETLRIPGNDTRYITATSGNTYTLSIPVLAEGGLDASSYKVGKADNYTIVLAVEATNGTRDVTYWCLYADGKGPSIEMTTPWVADSKGKATENRITEDDSNWQIVTQNGITVNDYTMRGFWSDKDGSGTDGLFFRTAAAGEKLIPDGALEALDEAHGWLQVASDDAPQDATDKIGINNTQKVREGSGWQIAIVATDKVGNRSEVLTYSNLVFDFGNPEVEIPALDEFYARSDDPLSFTITARDSNLVKENGLVVTASRNGKAVASGKNGFTVSYGDVVPRAESMVVADAFNTEKRSTLTATVTLVRDGTADSDGVWTFSAVATDQVGRTSGTVTVPSPITVDSTLPEAVLTAKNPLTIDDRAFSESRTDWFTKDTLTVSGFYKEETSGLDTVYFLVKKEGEELEESVDDITQLSGVEQIPESGSAGEAVEFSITPSSLSSGRNTLYVQVSDKAGNRSVVKAYPLNVDLDIPDVSAELYTYDGSTFVSAKSAVLSNGKKPLVLYGLVSDEVSGVADFASGLTVGGTAVSAKVQYSDAAREGDADAAWFSGAEFKAYGDIQDKSKISAWKAEIGAGDIKAGSVKLRISDVAGNSSQQTLFSFNLDNEAPRLALTSPEKGSPLNGTVSFSGTAKDNALDSVSLFYSYSSKSAALTEGDVQVTLSGGSPAKVSGSEAYSWKFDGVEISSYEDGKTVLLGGEDYEGAAKAVYFKVRALDTAGNETVEVYEYTIDPDTDRPVITFSNVTEDKKTLLKNTTVYGSVSDDDGSIAGLWYTTDGQTSARPTADDDNGWTRIDVQNGTFSAEAEGGDGERVWYFYCIDAAGGAFMTRAGQSLARPYIHFAESNAKSDNRDGITFKVDTEAPEISSFKVSRAPTGTKTAPAQYAPDGDGDSQWRDEDKVAFGGNYGALYIQLKVMEATAMDGTAPVSVFIGDSEVPVGDGNLYTEASGSSYTYVIGPVDVTTGEYESTTQTLTVSVKDLAGTSVQQARNIIIDNKAPTVNMTTPLSTTLISSTVTVRGSMFDNQNGAGIESVKWMIPTQEEARAGVNAGTKRSGVSVWNQLSSTSTLFIEFNSTAHGNPENILTYANETYAELSGAKELGQYKVPIYFLKTDVLGNSEVDTEKFIVVDTLAGKPVAEIIYPDPTESSQTVGGTINIHGSARDDFAVKDVRVQLDVNGDGKFDAADYALLTAADGWLTKNEWTQGVDIFPSSGENDWYILASGTNTWKLSLKVPDSFVTDSSGNARTRSLGIRACAYDDVPQTRGWLSQVSVTVDKNVPVIGSLKVVQYDAGGTAVSERDYSSGMYISGADTSARWFLEGTATDDGSVKSVIFENQSGSTISLEGSYEWNSHEPYQIKMPLSTDADGRILSKLTVTDDNNTRAEQLILINVDNEAPALYSTSNAEVRTATRSLRLTAGSSGVLDNSSTLVQNSNGVFRFGDVVAEEGSGLSFVAFYFVRRSSDNGDRVYNPMFKDGNRTAIAGDLSINGDGLAVLSVSGASRSAENTVSHARFRGNANIRKGGLIKIGGVYRLIDAVDLDSGTVTFTPSVGTSYTSAQVVYAQVVDNKTTERAANGTDYTNIENDDGDEMVETIETAGSLSTWTASVFSDNIPDGPIEIHVVAIDEAGNLSQGVCSTSVQNNRPRIAKLLLATDLNGNGTFDFEPGEGIVNDGSGKGTADGTDFGEFRFFSTLDQNGRGTYDSTIEAPDGNVFTAKDGLLLLPEFVGGNTSILTTYTVADSISGAVRTTKDSGTVLSLSPADAVKEKVSEGAHEHISGFGGIIMGNDQLKAYESRTSASSSAPKYFALTFWDETEETEQGTTSQWALLRFPLVVDVVDSENPQPSITPFYWNSKDRASSKVAYNSLEDTSNSVYKSAKGELLGHIELPADWKQSTYYDKKGVGAGTQFDADPKVSGKIRIQGEAYDEKRLGSISVSISKFSLGSSAGAAAVLAQYNTSAAPGAWSFTNEAASVTGEAGWQFRILSDSMTQAGHTAVWELDLDTEKLEGVAAADIKITVQVKDSGGGDADAELMVDVVPYISSVSGTKLSAYKKANPSVYSRTAQGHYPVYIARSGFEGGASVNLKTDSIELSGWNLSGGSATSGSTALEGSGTSYTLTEESASGALEVTVSGIVSLNNRNHNDAHGAYVPKKDAGTTGDASVYANYYNRAPNGVNNNLLTDDVILDVWDMNSKAAMGYDQNVRVANAVMKVNPSNKLIGFAFSNGALRFSMPNTSNSYEKWSMSYDYMGYTALSYGSDGASYGVAVGGDINASNARDDFSFMTSRWGPVLVGSDQGANVGSKNHVRLDTIGQGSEVLKNRFQSQSLAALGDAVYLAYYDLINKEIRFKAGTFADQNGKSLFWDCGGNSATSYATTLAQCQVIAASGHTQETLGSAGKYVSIAVTKDNTVVLVWYDGSDLLYTYNKTPLESATEAEKRGYVRTSGSSWEGPYKVFTDAGEHCQVAVGSDGSVHVAAYDSANGDLLYAYLSRPDAIESGEFDTAKVDTYLDVGENLSIDVAQSGDYQIPYISYWGAYPELPRHAFLAKPESFYGGLVQDGAQGDKYTGVWECSLVPSPSQVNEALVSVGVWKEDGKLTDSKVDGEIKYKSSTAGTVTGNCYGNGSDHAVLGYVVSVGSSASYIETAQMR